MDKKLNQGQCLIEVGGQHGEFPLATQALSLYDWGFNDGSAKNQDETDRRCSKEHALKWFERHARSVFAAAPQPAAAVECHGLDTPERVCFYEQDFYVLSNFSSFNLHVPSGFAGIPDEGLTFSTSEHAYHWHKFSITAPEVADAILLAPSAHEAFKIAARHKAMRWGRWDEFKIEIMRDLLRLKVEQHEYVRRKLLATGERELVENSWRDDFWGWGPKRDGQNMLGKLWMEIRAELRGIGSSKEGGAAC